MALFLKGYRQATSQSLDTLTLQNHYARHTDVVWILWKMKTALCQHKLSCWWRVIFSLSWMRFLPSFKRRLKIGFGVLLNKTPFTLPKSLQILPAPLLNLIFQGKTMLVFLAWNCPAASAGPWPLWGNTPSIIKSFRKNKDQNCTQYSTNRYPRSCEMGENNIFRQKNVRYERTWPAPLLCNLSWLWKLPSVSNIFPFPTLYLSKQDSFIPKVTWKLLLGAYGCEQARKGSCFQGVCILIEEGKAIEEGMKRGGRERGKKEGGKKSGRRK